MFEFCLTLMAIIAAALDRFWGLHKEPKKPRIITSKVVCPLCLDYVSGVFQCGKCKTQMHQDCWNELSQGKCPTLGCV